MVISGMWSNWRNIFLLYLKEQGSGAINYHVSTKKQNTLQD